MVLLRIEINAILTKTNYRAAGKTLHLRFYTTSPATLFPMGQFTLCITQLHHNLYRCAIIYTASANLMVLSA
jgi:hypothetical protein